MVLLEILLAGEDLAGVLGIRLGVLAAFEGGVSETGWGCLRNRVYHVIRWALLFWWLEVFDSWILRLLCESFSLPGFEEIPIPSVDCSIGGSD